MKKLMLLSIVLIVGCAKEPEPINIVTLVERDKGMYTKDTNKPYTGAVFVLREISDGGGKAAAGYLKGGKWDGKLTLYNEDGSINQVIEYKDGELVK